MTWIYDLEQQPGEGEVVFVVAQFRDTEKGSLYVARLAWRNLTENERALAWQTTETGAWLAPDWRVYGWMRPPTPKLPAEMDEGEKF